MIPNYELRARARKAIKPMMQVLIVIALVAALPGLLADTIVLITKASPVYALDNTLVQYAQIAQDVQGMTESAYNQAMLQLTQTILNDLTTYAKSDAFRIFAGMTLLSVVLTPALSMGLYHALIRTIRGQEVTIGLAWPGGRRCYKGIGVSFMTYVMMVLWTIPGAIAGSVCLVFLPGSLGSIAYTVSFFAALWMCIRAYFSYAMAPFIVADQPKTGMFAAMKQSRKIMHGRRMLLFSVELSFYIWMMGISLLQSMLEGIFGMVIAMTLGMFANLFLQVYLNGTLAMFYEMYVVKGVKPGTCVPTMDPDPEQLTDEEEK